MTFASMLAAGVGAPDVAGSWWFNSAASQKPQSRQSAENLAGDRAWIERVRNGDEEAARGLVQRLYPTVMRSIRCHLPRRTSEEDLAQVVFAKIFKRLGSFSGTVPLEHWVSRITINTCLNQLKHEKRRPEWRMADLGEEEEAVVQHLVSTGDDLAWEHREAARELVDKMLAMLKPDERLVIKLLHLEQRSVQQVSRLTGWTISRVKVKAFRTRLKMRRIWEVTLKGVRP
jgi:RNA polymerase sigma factor (sigma-70 family)